MSSIKLRKLPFSKVMRRKTSLKKIKKIESKNVIKIKKDVLIKHAKSY